MRLSHLVIEELSHQVVLLLERTLREKVRKMMRRRNHRITGDEEQLKEEDLRKYQLL